jgi:hypothetical protein
MSRNHDRDVPPHLGDQEREAPPPVPPPEQPALDPQLQNAMTALVTAMTRQFRDQALAARTPSPPANIHDAPRSRVKTRDPDPYDGSDPAKLRAFISQCKLVFRARPRDFQDDIVKITYAVSWLKGTALRWYEPNLTLDEHQLPQYALDWDTFEETLKTTFGEPDPVQTATYKLDSLRMQDYHHITKYNVEFNEYATITGFDERALYAKYYRGLAPRIKDGLVYSGKPDTLVTLRAQAINLNLRHWERRDEERLKNAASAQSSSKSPQGTSLAMSSSSGSSRSKSSHSKSASRSSTPAASGSSSSASKKPDLSKVLGPDRKLLPEEKERRKKQGLCIICASKDHMAERCPSRKSSTQGRAATLEPVSEGHLSEGSASEAESSESQN